MNPEPEQEFLRKRHLIKWLGLTTATYRAMIEALGGKKSVDSRYIFRKSEVKRLMNL